MTVADVPLAAKVCSQKLPDVVRHLAVLFFSRVFLVELLGFHNNKNRRTLFVFCDEFSFSNTEVGQTNTKPFW